MKKWIKITLWTLFSIGIITIMMLIHHHDQNRVIDPPDIRISMEGADPFLTKAEVHATLHRAHLIYKGQRKSELSTAKIERRIRAISHVKEVEVYQFMGPSWQISITIRRPIARIFNKYGESYYLDKDGYAMSTTPLHSAHILVVSGDIPDRKTSKPVSEIINNDSLKSIRKLDDVYRISNYVCDDPLFRSLIGQIHLEKNGDFILVPLVGNHRIVFGSAFTEREVSEKFEKLKIFYKEAVPYEGWGKYKEISLKFKDQIVCKKVHTDI